MVAIIACPNDDHKVDLKVGRGFFLIDAADVARKTMEGMLGYADSTQDIQTALPTLLKQLSVVSSQRKSSALKATPSILQGLIHLVRHMPPQPVDSARLL